MLANQGIYLHVIWLIAGNNDKWLLLSEHLYSTWMELLETIQFLLQFKSLLCDIQ